MANVRILGLSNLYSKLDDLEEVTDTQDLLDTMGAFMLHKIRERFLNQEAPNSTRWKESYAAKRRRDKNIGGGTLFATGNLFHSISLGRSGINGRSIFTTVEYAEKHNEGLDGEERREFLGFNPTDEQSMVNIINRRIRSLL